MSKEQKTKPVKKGEDQFDPNAVTFAEGEVRVQRALKRAGVNIRERIVTSKDPAARKLAEVLQVRNVPKGFTKYQLPIVMERSQLFISSAEPNVKAGKHSHDEGDGIRFIVSGSIRYNGQTLGAGDWMFIPAGLPYSFTVGPEGALMAYCYSCCCVGRLDLADFLSDPAEQVR